MKKNSSTNSNKKRIDMGSTHTKSTRYTTSTFSPDGDKIYCDDNISGNNVISISGNNNVVSINNSGRSNSHLDLVGNGVKAMREIALSPITSVESNGTIDVEIRKGENDNIVVRGDENIVDFVDVKQYRDKISIGMKSGGYSFKQPLTASITTTRDITYVSNDGTGSVDVYAISPDSFQARLSGTGSMRLVGKTGYCKLNVSGVGNIDASGFTATDADLVVSGIGIINSIRVKSQLKQNVSGLGSINFRR